LFFCVQTGEEAGGVKSPAQRLPQFMPAFRQGQGALAAVGGISQGPAIVKRACGCLCCFAGTDGIRKRTAVVSEAPGIIESFNPAGTRGATPPCGIHLSRWAWSVGFTVANSVSIESAMPSGRMSVVQAYRVRPRSSARVSADALSRACDPGRVHESSLAEP
jgi:hypothetical protein